jgi:hypothetical protein
VRTIAADQFDAKHPIQFRRVDTPLSGFVEAKGKPAVLHRAVQCRTVSAAQLRRLPDPH